MADAVGDEKLCPLLGCLATIGFSLTFLKVLEWGGPRGGVPVSRDRWLWQAVGVAVWSLLYGLLTLAFALLSLVLVAYVGAVGWVTLGFACLVGILSVTWIVLEAR
ncbi:hypothetical protein MMYC01_208838 [Madurella mycetomatis]|uniref:Uncharacterized protein n=1 Tax=Madurella mycetomatis TaxID=100816 RepID=A0A175VSR1_9PEZI|nr:hypothetical protein MMYC01_210041 [Madurella mycetomatis]KXX74219.1 hypothetical protein MMYC01_208838 [Madurella mycetomatis]